MGIHSHVSIAHWSLSAIRLAPEVALNSHPPPHHMGGLSHGQMDNPRPTSKSQQKAMAYHLDQHLSSGILEYSSAQTRN